MSAARTAASAAPPIVARVKSLKQNATVAQIDETLEAVKGDLAAAEVEHQKLSAARRAVLLEGTDEEAAAHDAQIAAALRRQDRARALIDDLGPRRTAASAREEAARLDARRKAAQDSADGLKASLAADYTAHAQAIAAFLARWKAGHEAIDAANAALRQAGRRDLVTTPEAALRGKPSQQMPDAERVRMDWFIGDRPIGPHVQVQDPRTGKMRPQEGGAMLREVREVVRGEFIPAQQLPALADTVRLPPVLIGAEPIWRGKPA